MLIYLEGFSDMSGEDIILRIESDDDVRQIFYDTNSSDDEGYVHTLEEYIPRTRSLNPLMKF